MDVRCKVAIFPGKNSSEVYKYFKEEELCNIFTLGFFFFFFFSHCKLWVQSLLPAVNPSQVCWTDSLGLWTLRFWFYCKKNNTEMSTEHVQVPEELWFLAWISLLIIRIFVLVWLLLFQITLFPYSPHGFITWQVLFTDQPLSPSKKEGQGLSVIF